MTFINKFHGPLKEINIIDFGHYYAGPMAGMLLADQGANVIRIVKPGERELPGPQYRLLNRNKKLLELDLKTEEDRVQALSLIERADVLNWGNEEGRASRFAEVVTGSAEADERALEAAFAGKSSEHWLKKLNDADIACHAVLCAEDICIESRIRPVGNEAADETAGATLEIFRWDDHPSGRPLMMPSMSRVRVGEDHSYLRLTPTPKVGAHTKEILTELGYDDNAVAELIRLNIAHEYLPAIGNRDEYFFQDHTPEVRGW